MYISGLGAVRDVCAISPESCSCLHKGDAPAITACNKAKIAGKELRANLLWASITAAATYGGYKAGGKVGAGVGLVGGAVVGAYAALMYHHG